MVAGGQIHLRVFGAFSAARDAAFSDPVRISSRKGCALLAYLAISPQQSATRDQLAALLWGNSSDRQARQSLRQALLLLRKDLEPATVIDADPETVRLLPGSVNADVVEFEALAASDAFAGLERAAGLAQGELFAGFHLEEEGFEEWLRQQRHRLDTAATGVLERYAEACDRLGKGPQAIAAAERLLALAPLREDWQRLALRLYARHRSPNEALAQAKVHADLLRRELDVEPEAETQALIEEIGRGGFAPARPPPDAPPAMVEPEPVGAEPPVPAPTPVAAAARRLRPWDRAGTLVAKAATWARLRPLAAGAALAAAVGLPLLIVAAVTVANSRSVSAPKVVLSAKMPTEAPAADPWASPRPPSLTQAEAAARRAKALIPILVLPFKTYGEAAGSTQLLADMMTDDVIHMLSRAGGLRVISRQTSQAYKDLVIDVSAIGAELQVRYILDGSLRLHGGKLRVNVELIDPKTRLAVWTNRIEREAGGRRDVQDEIVGRLARELRLDLFPIESERRSKDADALAYRGWAAMTAAFAQSNAGAFKKTLDLFMQALERDPHHLIAQMGVAGYHLNIGAQRLDADPRAHVDKAWNILQQVARQWPESALVHHQLGYLYVQRGKLQEALDSYERSIELNPSSANTHAHLGRTLMRMGRVTEGLEHVHYAVRLSPREPMLAYWLEWAGTGELELGHFQQAIDYLARSRALNPDYAWSLAGLVAAHALAGNKAEARAHADKLRSLAPNLTAEGLIARFSRPKEQMPRLREGLTLALASRS
jgi:DNA-binding SARP family transcriptional activator/TolB-like protein/Tfp pilus assembly protein PilF